MEIFLRKYFAYGPEKRSYVRRTLGQENFMCKSNGFNEEGVLAKMSKGKTVTNVNFAIY